MRPKIAKHALPIAPVLWGRFVVLVSVAMPQPVAMERVTLQLARTAATAPKIAPAPPDKPAKITLVLLLLSAAMELVTPTLAKTAPPAPPIAPAPQDNSA